MLPCCTASACSSAWQHAHRWAARGKCGESRWPHQQLAGLTASSPHLYKTQPHSTCAKESNASIRQHKELACIVGANAQVLGYEAHDCRQVLVQVFIMQPQDRGVRPAQERL